LFGLKIFLIFTMSTYCGKEIAGVIYTEQNKLFQKEINYLYNRGVGSLPFCRRLLCDDRGYFYSHPLGWCLPPKRYQKFNKPIWNYL
jgi:hypothetical protein